MESNQVYQTAGSAEQELKLIRKIMEDSKQTAVDNGKHYILWGVLVSIALIFNYLMILANVNKGEYIGYMWFSLMIFGAVTSTVIKFRELKKARVQTFAGKILSSLWLSCGIAMFILAFIPPNLKVFGYYQISPMISIVLGIAYYVSGEIQQIKWFRLLTAGWWIGGIFMFAFPGIHSLLIFGLMLLFFQTIPGIILYMKWKKEISMDAVNAV